MAETATPNCWARPDRPDYVGCAACFAEQHMGHDVGWRHEGGRLDSATCHDCMEVYRCRPVSLNHGYR